jgi:hypothetical protein
LLAFCRFPDWVGGGAKKRCVERRGALEPHVTCERTLLAGADEPERRVERARLRRQQAVAIICGG